MSVAAANAPPTLLFQDAQGAPLAGVILFQTQASEDGHSDGSGLTPTVHVMNQMQRQFVPDLLLVAAGDRVSFPNSDSIRHHVYSFSPTRSRMDDHQISISAQNRLLALLAPMHAEIVNH